MASICDSMMIPVTAYWRIPVHVYACEVLQDMRYNPFTSRELPRGKFCGFPTPITRSVQPDAAGDKIVIASFLCSLVCTATNCQLMISGTQVGARFRGSIGDCECT